MNKKALNKKYSKDTEQTRSQNSLDLKKISHLGMHNAKEIKEVKEVKPKVTKSVYD